MLFSDDLPEDKGLFTFYREQAERDEEIKRNKKLKKKLKKQLLENVEQDHEAQPLLSPPPVPQPPHKLKLTPKLSPPKDFDFKQKTNVPKQRLVQSVVDMAKQIEDENQMVPDYLSVKLRFKQPTFISKTRKYREKILELNQSLQRQPSHFQEERIPEQIRIESYHRRNQSEDLDSSRSKPAIHSARGSVVELPQIRKSEMPYRPKKSIKSKLIQEALRLKDRNKIRHIREYLKASPPTHEPQPQELDFRQQFDIDNQSFAIFEQHQQKIFAILKRFRRCL